MKYPTIEKRGLCPICGQGNMYVVEMPDHEWINYCQVAHENGWPIAQIEIAAQCDTCEVVAIYESPETECEDTNNHELQ